MDLRNEIEEIRKYTQQHPELLKSHHFLYDLKLSPENTECFIVMGINPGESRENWNLSTTPTEETSLYDFLHATRASIRWTKVMRKFMDTENIVQSELFFWSSVNMKQLEERYGPLKDSKHLAFCRRMNGALFDHYKPKAIIFPGLSAINIARQLYGLTYVKTYNAEDKSRLVEHYTDGIYPWIFTRHWTGAFGFSNSQRQKTKQIIHQILKY